MYVNVIPLTAESWCLDVLDDAHCVNIGSRSVYCEAASI